MPYFKNRFIKTDVTAIKIIDNYILAGIGGDLLIYKTILQIELIHRLLIFENGYQIHGFDYNEISNEILMYGATKLVVCKFLDDSIEKVGETTQIDWILRAQFIRNTNQIGICLMNNKFLLVNYNFEIFEEYLCAEKCILYSAYICDTFNELILMSGTVFSEILIWKPNENCNTCFKLQGHKGVIFDIAFNEINNFIVSCSDDRSIILWQAQHTLPSELNKPNPVIEQKYRLFGHLSRVFRCKITENYFTSAGEDGLINVWNFNGKLEKRIDVNQGGCIWAMDCRKDILVAGGTDGGVTIFPIENHKQIQTISSKAKKFVIMQSGKLVVVCEKGHVFYVNSKQEQLVDNSGIFEKYCILQVSNCRKLVAICGYNGEIHIYRENQANLEEVLKFETETKSRIYAFHFLTCKLFLISEQRILQMYILTTCLKKVQTFHLPNVKNNHSTAAILLKHYILIGDRKGNLYLFHVAKNQPVQTIKKLHSHMGITQISLNCNRIITMGRDGLLKHLNFNEYHKSPLTIISTDKLSFNWPTNFISNQQIVGFSGRNFILYDYSTKRILIEENCGGGHRCWDFYNSNLAYVKDKAIQIITYSRFEPKEIACSHHIREINSLKCIEMFENKLLIISGGEDTNLRLSSLDLNNSTNDLENLINLKSHLSSIRCIALKKLEKSENYLLVSAGGRQQLISWQLKIDGEQIICNELNQFYSKDLNECETRIMDLVIDKCFVFAACSDGNILVFNDKLELQQKVCSKHKKCITKLALVSNMKMLISCATDGNVNFWNENWQIVQSYKLHQSGINTISTNVNNDNLACLTGGDDNAIHLNIFHIVKQDETFQIEKICVFNDCGSHCAQINGSFLTDNYFVTCSIDQKLILFKWNFEENVLNCEKMAKFDSSICDIQGIECLPDISKIILYGKGFNVVECCLK